MQRALVFGITQTPVAVAIDAEHVQWSDVSDGLPLAPSVDGKWLVKNEKRTLHLLPLHRLHDSQQGTDHLVAITPEAMRLLQPTFDASSSALRNANVYANNLGRQVGYWQKQYEDAQRVIATMKVWPMWRRIAWALFNFNPEK